MITVVCWKWGNLFSSVYVNRLRTALERHLHLEHELVCVTDDATGIADQVVLADAEQFADGLADMAAAALVVVQSPEQSVFHLLPLRVMLDAVGVRVDALILRVADDGHAHDDAADADSADGGSADGGGAGD